jgi:hypothetical protein
MKLHALKAKSVLAGQLNGTFLHRLVVRLDLVGVTYWADDFLCDLGFDFKLLFELH